MAKKKNNQAKKDVKEVKKVSKKVHEETEEKKDIEIHNYMDEEIEEKNETYDVTPLEDAFEEIESDIEVQDKKFDKMEAKIEKVEEKIADKLDDIEEILESDDTDESEITKEDKDEIINDIKENKEKRKKRYRLKKSALVLLGIIIIILIGIFAGVSFYKYVNSDPYLLEKKGYTEKEVNRIIKDKDLTLMLLEMDYNEYILDIIDAKYYLSKNLDKYLEYKEKNKDLSIDDVVAIINVHADKEWYNHTISTDTTKDYLILVNKVYYLEEDFEAPNIVNMSVRYAFSGRQIRQDVYSNFIDMAVDAKKEGLTLVANSTFRTYATQEKTYNYYKTNKGSAYADSYAARPGHSEHQTGLAIDISTLNSTSENFEDTPEFNWLIDNAYKYGFILRYPENKEHLTGFDYESWHYRFVGLDVAKKIHEENITFDEYYAYYIEGDK